MPAQLTPRPEGNQTTTAFLQSTGWMNHWAQAKKPAKCNMVGNWLTALIDCLAIYKCLHGAGKAKSKLLYHHRNPKMVSVIAAYSPRSECCRLWIAAATPATDLFLRHSRHVSMAQVTHGWVAFSCRAAPIQSLYSALSRTGQELIVLENTYSVLTCARCRLTSAHCTCRFFS